MTSSDNTQPDGSEAVPEQTADHTAQQDAVAAESGDHPTTQAVLKRGNEPVVTEVLLGGGVPRSEPDAGRRLSGDLYIRLEGQIYGPFQPDTMDEILQSGKLTGLEVASPDLKRWTPLAYHPRIVRGRVRDFDRSHSTLRDLSALPARKHEPLTVLPLAAVVRRPSKSHEAVTAGEDDDTPTESILDR